VTARLRARLRAELVGARLRGLEDRADLLGRARGEARRGRVGGATHPLDLVGEAAQMRIDRRRVVAAAGGREVASLDVVAVQAHAEQDNRPRLVNPG
jgi:hypothetical protein